MAAIVTGAMGTLLPKLAMLLTEEFKLQKNIKGEIMFLKAELESMEAALIKVSEAPIHQQPDIQVKLWAREVRELSYEIEDSIDTFMVRIHTHAPKKPSGLKGFINRSLKLLTKAKIRHKIGTDIRDIKKRIREVSERRDRYKVDIHTGKTIGPSIDSLRLSALYKNATELVGIEEKSYEFIKMLDLQSKETFIVSIVGFGGLGKTTLAKIVYDKLMVQFQCGAFVSVSHNPDMTHIFKSMLDQLGCHNYKATWHEAQLISKLREFLEIKRYFIVIDDIWNSSVWVNIQYALIQNECGSRVVTTTRILDVGRQADIVYQLKPLSVANSRKLFYLRIFGIKEECPQNELVEVAENILRKCGGVPLAIITIASLLANKMGKGSTWNYWSEVYQSMGSGLEDSPDVKNMRNILSISYYDLPPHLKTCLLYLSLYPEDYEIRTDHLIWKWIGEGFVRREQGKTIYEVGESYVDELINRSMIKPSYIDPDSNKASFCLVHDMILDLITCLSNEDHFLTKIDGQQPVTSPIVIRRLSVQTTTEDHVKQLAAMSLSHVRSLTVFAFKFFPALSIFPVLRVLDLSGCQEVHNQHFKSLCHLFYLRYLGLNSTSITEIPKEIENLQFLQVLDIKNTTIVELPSTFGQLQQLVCLRAESLKRIQGGLGDLKYLQELGDFIFVMSPTMLNNLRGLIDLRRLTLYFHEWNESYEKPFLRCLSSLVSLEHLEMYECNGDLGSQCETLSPGPQQLWNIQMMCCPIRAVPRWMSTLSALSIINMRFQTIGTEDIQVLGNIPSLICLTMWVEKQTEDRPKRLVIGNCYPFYYLRELKIYNIVEVMFAPKAMQKLESLELRFQLRQMVDQFVNFELGLETLPSLKVVSVELDCYNAMPLEVKDAQTSIRHAIDMNPNKPTLQLTCNSTCFFFF